VFSQTAKGPQICYHDITKIEPSRGKEWIKSLLKSHNHVIFATNPDKDVAFDTMLLWDEEWVKNLRSTKSIYEFRLNFQLFCVYCLPHIEP
jgi:hypothetical protein